MRSSTSGEQSRSDSILRAGGEPDTRVSGVEDGVVVLQELLADDEVNARRATVVDPGVVSGARDAEVYERMSVCFQSKTQTNTHSSTAPAG
jgi:hypothetical protein